VFGWTVDREVFLRFVAGDAFRVLGTKHDLTYVMVANRKSLDNTALTQNLQSSGKQVIWVPFNPERFKRWKELFDISCILHESRSSSLAVRNQEGWARDDPDWFAHLKTLARPGVYEDYRDRMERNMGVHPEILTATLRERPDFFVLPSALLDCVTDDVLQIAEALSIPTLLLVAGWDNLSSKGLLYHKPTLVGVWGEQSKKHAVEVQGLDADRVYVVGAPHYDGFRKSEHVDQAVVRQALGLPSTGILVLFAGTLRLFDETQLLQEMDDAIDSGNLPAMHILYRPHPLRDTRRSERSFLDRAWRHITMDPEMVEAYRARSPDSVLSRIDHLQQLYQTVDAVISPMSTILLEGLLFGLPTMAVAFGDGKHSWSADKVSRMLHFKELYEVPSLIVCRERTDFFLSVRQLVSNVGNDILSTSLRESAKYFVYHDELSYGDRIAALVEIMLAGVQRTPRYDSVRVKPDKRFLIRNWWNDSRIKRLSHVARRKFFRWHPRRKHE